jgi:hypothetical protein
MYFPHVWAAGALGGAGSEKFVVEAPRSGRALSQNAFPQNIPNAHQMAMPIP